MKSVEIKFFKNLWFSHTRSEFQMRLKQPLLQTICLKNFIHQYNINDTLTVDINAWQVPKKSHEFVVFIVNPHSFISIQQLDCKIQELSSWAKSYYYIAVNKFLVFSETDNPTDANSEFDEKLLLRWNNLIAKPVLLSHSRSDDHGSLGNFIHPVTFMAWKMHE